MAQVLIVDEISTRKEAAAVRTIAQRGVTIVATAHGASLAHMISNPELWDLLGASCILPIIE